MKPFPPETGPKNSHASGASGTNGASGANVNPADARLSSADDPMERALSSALHPEPRPEFLSELRERFVTVPFAMDRGRGGRVRSAPWSDVRAAPRAGSRAARVMLAAGLLALASVAVALWNASRRPPARWEIVDGFAPASDIVVDGRDVASADIAPFLGSTGARTLATRDESLRLALGELMTIELAPRTEVVLGARDARTSIVALTARKGSVRVSTHAAFAGSRLEITTPDAEVIVTGTCFAIDVDDDGTCVCCFEGAVAMQAPAAFSEPWSVETGKMCRVFHDGRAPKWDAIVADHEAPLRALHDSPHARGR